MTAGKDSLIAEKKLLAQARKGSEKAYRELYLLYRDRLSRVILSMVGSREDAEDILQQTFIRAFDSLNKFHGKSSFYTWIYRIAVNTSTDFLRSRAGKYLDKSLDNSVDGRSLLDTLAAPDSDNPESETHNNELSSFISEAIAELGDEHREVLVLREISGFSYNEIAETTGVEPGTVMSRLHYARRKLAENLRRRGLNLDEISS